MVYKKGDSDLDCKDNSRKIIQSQTQGFAGDPKNPLKMAPLPTLPRCIRASHTKKRDHSSEWSLLVRVARLELGQDNCHYPLKVARLPFRHIRFDLGLQR